MGRRKKEPRSAHREKIAAAAQTLFLDKGIAATSMDEIAKAAGYSKATLYVYFKNKEEIISVLVMCSMKKLYTCIAEALDERQPVKKKYDKICYALLRYQQEFPFYFHIALDHINIDFQKEMCFSEEKEAFYVGEEINKKMEAFLKDGIAAGEIRPDIEIMPTIFSFWAMLSGLIQMADNKEAYIAQEMKLSKQAFLQYGFNTLYRAIARRNENE